MTDEDKLGLDVSKFAMPQTPLPEWAQQAVAAPEETVAMAPADVPEELRSAAAALGVPEDVAASIIVDATEYVPEDLPSIEEEVEAPASDAHNMSWMSARLCLRRGQKVRRNGWAHEGLFLSMNGEGEIEITRIDGVWPYPNPKWDMLANDWQIVG